MAQAQAAAASHFTPAFQSLRTRGWIVACLYLTVVASLPFWLKTTTIERLPLPRAKVAAWEALLPCPVRFPHRLHLHLPKDTLSQQGDYDDVANRIEQGLYIAGDGAARSLAGQRRVHANATDEFLEEQVQLLEHASCIDWDIKFGPASETNDAAVNYVVDVPGRQSGEMPQSLLGLRRISLPEEVFSKRHTSQELATILIEQLAEAFQLPYRDANSVEASATQQTSMRQAESDKRQIPYTRRVRLVFSLANEDMSARSPENVAGSSGDHQYKEAAGVAGWNGAELEKVFSSRIKPLLKSLEGIYSFTTELQSIWFAPLQFKPHVVELPDPDQSQNAENASAIKEIESSSSENGAIAEHEDGEAISSNEQSPAKTQKVHLIDWSDLQIFVHAGEWGLSTGGAAPAVSTLNTSTNGVDLDAMSAQDEKTLHFVLYVPQPAHRPLQIAGDASASISSTAKGWLVPQWGGVALYNLGYEDIDRSVTRSAGSTRMVDSLSADELDGSFATFEKQLRSLLGVKTVVRDRRHAMKSLAHNSANERLAIDALLRRRILETSRESVQTLASIVRLVDKIKVLGVDQTVRDDVQSSLRLLEEAEMLVATRSAGTNTTSQARKGAPSDHLPTLLDLSSASALLSSRAFFNPRMLGQLYFPDEHKYAVYTPLFGPLAVPLLVAGLRLIKERRAQRSVQR